MFGCAFVFRKWSGSVAKKKSHPWVAPHFKADDHLNHAAIGAAAALRFFAFLRQSAPTTPRPEMNIGKAAGNGVCATSSDALSKYWWVTPLAGANCRVANSV